MTKPLKNTGAGEDNPNDSMPQFQTCNHYEITHEDEGENDFHRGIIHDHKLLIALFKITKRVREGSPKYPLPDNTENLKQE